VALFGVVNISCAFFVGSTTEKLLSDLLFFSYQKFTEKEGKKNKNRKEDVVEKRKKKQK